MGLIQHLNTPCPIWNAGMGGVAGPELVAAVTRHGGFGVLGTGGSPAEGVIDLVGRTRALTDRPFGANIILPLSDGSDVRACMDLQVPVVVLFWGDPQPFVADAHRRGLFVVAQCGDDVEAAAAVAAGVDAVIAQGVEAGGHVKAVAPLAATLPEVVAAAGSVPVIAAGGIATGADIAAALGLGARAVSIGTRFVASVEGAATEAYKARVVSADAADTVLTQLYDIGWPNANHRVIRNRAFEIWDAAGRPETGTRPGEGEPVGSIPIGDRRVTVPRYSVYPPIAGFEGDLEDVPLYAGESVARIDRVEPVAHIMSRLMRELHEAT